MNNNPDLQAIKKHSYPLWIYAMGTIALFLYLCSTMYFFCYELSYHRNLSKKIAKAHYYFTNKDYEQAITLYTKITTDHPEFELGKTRLAKSYFALCKQDGEIDSYLIGLYYLGKESYKQSEINEIAAFLPDHLKEDFFSQFKKA